MSDNLKPVETMKPESVVSVSQSTDYVDTASLNLNPELDNFRGNENNRRVMDRRKAQEKGLTAKAKAGARNAKLAADDVTNAVVGDELSLNAAASRSEGDTHDAEVSANPEKRVGGTRTGNGGGAWGANS